MRPCEFYKITAVANFDLGAGAGAGTITFVQDGCSDKVKIITNGDLRFYDESGEVLRGGQRGFHIHVKGLQEDNCGPSSTGGHFNPFHAPSGHFNNNRKNREVGQIGQLNCDRYG